MTIKAIKTRIFKEGEELISFISDHLPEIPEGSVLVVTSKIVALAEKRTIERGSDKIKENLIKSESDWAIRTKHVWLTVKDGAVMASAGIDESNADNKLILLPKNSFTSAARLRRLLVKKHRIKKLGVVITDSRTMPLRSGVMGMAIGYAGFHGLKDYRGEKDIFGRKFKFSQVNVADSLAAAAVLMMGEGAERQPLALIRGMRLDFCDRIKPNELRIRPKDDMYAPLFRAIG